MLKMLSWGALFVAASAIPALAEDNCPVPPVPVIVNGATATRDQVMESLAAAKTYIALADTYQACIRDYVAATKAQADKDKQPLDPAVIKAEDDKAAASEKSSQTVRDAVNNAVIAFKSAHPT